MRRPLALRPAPLTSIATLALRFLRVILITTPIVLIARLVLRVGLFRGEVVRVALHELTKAEIFHDTVDKLCRDLVFGVRVVHTLHAPEALADPVLIRHLELVVVERDGVDLAHDRLSL